jgi:hypothetical protein
MTRSAPGVDAVSGLIFPLWEIPLLGVFWPTSGLSRLRECWRRLRGRWQSAESERLLTRLAARSRSLAEPVLGQAQDVVGRLLGQEVSSARDGLDPQIARGLRVEHEPDWAASA